ncbi:hypothetical protein AVV50_gp39 [Pseudomonas phage PaMx42]|nr:hypothetical protein AVV50_gp39 [Pseudomonas phage PaMx42]ALH23562.1 hypothetical protein PaMx42_39 [Pseudomonas phage PaMx42]
MNKQRPFGAIFQGVQQMFAHYFASKKTKFVVISETNRPEGQRIAVSGKAEARRVAKERNAQPWNF